jgi:hypothetical protein
MKTRYLWMAVGLAFAVTLAVIVGQRMSAEAMAVMVGVIAGVAASIPTSLIVVWFATRTMARPAPEPVSPAPAPRPAPQPEPRVVVMAPPAPAPSVGYQNCAGYPAPIYPMYAQAALAQPALPPRRFTVIGGAEIVLDEPQPPEEVVWQR